MVALVAVAMPGVVEGVVGEEVRIRYLSNKW
jgi:hypothetical protein